jgi:putative transposase
MRLSSDIRHGRHCVFQLHVHLVFLTKYRKKIFEVCLDFEAQLVERNGEVNHLHLLVNYPPKHSLSSLGNSLKGVSSRLLRLERPDMGRGRTFCGRLPTSLLVVVVLPSPSCVSHRATEDTQSLIKERGPYIPALKNEVLRPHG